MKKLSNVTLTPLQATRFLKIFIRLKNTYEIHVEGDESKDEIKTMEEYLNLNVSKPSSSADF